MKNRKVSLGVLALITASLVMTVAAGPVLAEETTNPVVVNVSDGGSKTVSTGTVNVEGEEGKNATAVDVTAHSNSQAAVTIDGDVNLTGTGEESDDEYAITDIVAITEDAYTNASASVEVSGDVTVTTSGDTAFAGGIQEMSWGSGTDMSVTVEGDLTAVSEDSRARGMTVSICDSDTTGVVEVGGDVTAEGKLWTIGIQADTLNGGEANVVVEGNVNAVSSEDEGIGILTQNPDGVIHVQVQGDVYGSTTGLVLGNYGEAVTDVLIEGTLSGGSEPIHLAGIADLAEDMTVTAWKIVPNQDQCIVGYNADEEFMTPEQIEECKNAAAALESNILYIIKLSQPGEGGTVSLTGTTASHGFDTAKEGETVTLQAALLNGYKVAGAYNGGTALTMQDAAGNYYIVVPKGGGVDLSVVLEKIEEGTTPAPAPLTPVPVTPAEAATAAAPQKNLIDEYAFTAAGSDAKISFYDDKTVAITLPDSTEISGTFAFVDGKLTFNGIQLEVTVNEDGSYHCVYTTAAGEEVAFDLSAEFVELLRKACEG